MRRSGASRLVALCAALLLAGCAMDAPPGGMWSQAGRSLGLGAAPALPANLTAEETLAFQARATQSYLMVSALTCRRHGDYNRFVRQLRPQLAQSVRVMQGYFRKQHGPQRGRQRFDTHLTELANTHSDMARGEAGRFCQGSGPVWAEASSARSLAQVAALADRYNIPAWAD